VDVERGNADLGALATSARDSCSKARKRYYQAYEAFRQGLGYDA